jgi:hypothetical protein
VIPSRRVSITTPVQLALSADRSISITGEKNNIPNPEFHKRHQYALFKRQNSGEKGILDQAIPLIRFKDPLKNPVPALDPRGFLDHEAALQA